MDGQEEKNSVLYREKVIRDRAHDSQVSHIFTSNYIGGEATRQGMWLNTAQFKDKLSGQGFGPMYCPFPGATGQGQNYITVLFYQRDIVGCQVMGGWL